MADQGMSQVTRGPRAGKWCLQLVARVYLDDNDLERYAEGDIQVSLGPPGFTPVENTAPEQLP